MKLWQLDSIVDGNRALLRSMASTNDTWSYLKTWYDQMDQLIHAQDRSKLDSILPDDYVLTVLQALEKTFFRADDGWIRTWQMSPSDEVISAVEIYEKYGGDVLETLMESGAVLEQ